MNCKRFAKEINKAVKEMGFTNYILFNDSSMFIGNYLNDYLDYESQIYYIRDNLINSPNPYWHTHGKRMEAEMIKKADVVVTNSIYYSDYAKSYNPLSFMVGQGCDTSMFDYKTQNKQIPDELKEIKKLAYQTNSRCLISFIPEVKRISGLSSPTDYQGLNWEKDYLVNHDLKPDDYNIPLQHFNDQGHYNYAKFLEIELIRP
jgi:hypothetical protein